MINELDSRQEARLFVTTLDEWTFEPQVITYGGILICRKGKARLKVNFKEWEMHEGAVITIFPNDVVLLTKDNGNDFEVEMLKYNASLLREASLIQPCARTAADRTLLSSLVSSTTCLPCSGCTSTKQHAPVLRSWCYVS